MKAVLTLAACLALTATYEYPADNDRNSCCPPACDCGCNEGGPCLCFCATPDRPKSEPKKAALPKLAMQSNWGEVTQNGTAIGIEGHTHWSAVGTILKSGKISIVWELLSDGRRAPGIYEWDGKKLIGRWNYGDKVSVEDGGELTGPTHPDTIHPLLMPPVEIQ
jgi:hypothetical protein